MIKDIIKFMGIFLLFLVAFMIGLLNLFAYYARNNRIKIESPHLMVNATDENDYYFKAEQYFAGKGNKITNLEHTFRTVFWTLFGLGESEATHLAPEYPDMTWTRNVGYCLYGAYCIASIIVLLNMLIAMMSKSYDLVDSGKDVEWKFARSQLYMEYIEEGSTLPVPFNIIPTPKAVLQLLKKGLKMLKKRGVSSSAGPKTEGGQGMQTGFENPYTRDFHGASHVKSSASNFCYDDGEYELTYKKVMDRIVKRFIHQTQRDVEQELTEGELEEIKQDISSFRFEILNQLGQQREQQEKRARFIQDALAELTKMTLSSDYKTSAEVDRLNTLENQSGLSRSGSGYEFERGVAPCRSILRTGSLKTQGSLNDISNQKQDVSYTSSITDSAVDVGSSDGDGSSAGSGTDCQTGAQDLINDGSSLGNNMTSFCPSGFSAVKTDAICKTLSDVPEMSEEDEIQEQHQKSQGIYSDKEESGASGENAENSYKYIREDNFNSKF